MSTYTWRGISGAFGTASDWINTTTGAYANPALTPPGTGDVAVFAGGGEGNVISGSGSVQRLLIQTSTSTTKTWFFNAALTAQSAAISAGSFFSSTGRLTLTGASSAGSFPSAGVINATVTFSGSTLDASAGSLLVGLASDTQSSDGMGNSLGLFAGSKATALQLTVGYGETGNVFVTGNGSTLTIVSDAATAGSGQLALAAQQTISGVTTSAATGFLTVQSGGVVNIANGLNDGNDGLGSIVVGTGGSLTVSSGSSEIGNLAGSIGVLTVSSGGTFTLAGGQLAVGNRAGANGDVTVSGGGSFVATKAADTSNYILEIGNQNASGGTGAAIGAVTVTGRGALLDLGQNGAAVGYYGNGTLNVLSGGVVKAVTTLSTGASGISSLAIGRYGSGTVNITGSGSVISATGFLYAGRAAGGTGVINVTSGGVLQQLSDPTGQSGIGIGNGDTLSGQLASGGTGFLNVNTSGAVFGPSSLFVGDNDCAGTVALDTGGTISVGGQIAVGTGNTFANASGTVTISGGASLRTAGPHVTQSASITIANQVSTTGSITVTGGGSVLDAGGDRITVGARGVGSLVVNSGATASAGNTLYADAAAEAGLSVATFSTGSGTALIDGRGTNLAVNGATTLAGGLTSAGGSGSLSVTNGAVATTTGLVLWSGATLAVDAASVFELGSGMAVAGGVSIQSGAALMAHGGAINAAIANAGTLSNDGALTVSGGVTGPGAITLLAGSTTTISGGIAGGSVGFADAMGRLALGAFTGSETVSAMQAGDVIDLLGITNATVQGNDVRAGTGDLSFSNLAGLPLSLAADGHGGTNVMVTVACYCHGTHVLTESGERRVEALGVGDMIVTGSGALRPVRWLGRRSYAGRFLRGRAHLLPVRIRAGALGGGLPRRDLLVSPCHAMLLDGLLVPAAMLLNGHSIVQEQAAERVDYVHVELDEHDVLFAEGALSESFLDDDSRAVFHNAADYVAPAGDTVPGTFCAPRVEAGYALEAIRARLQRLASAA